VTSAIDGSKNSVR
jgi:hypothetical protein